MHIRSLFLIAGSTSLYGSHAVFGEALLGACLHRPAHSISVIAIAEMSDSGSPSEAICVARALLRLLSLSLLGPAGVRIASSHDRISWWRSISNGWGRGASSVGSSKSKRVTVAVRDVCIWVVWLSEFPSRDRGIDRPAWHQEPG